MISRKRYKGLKPRLPDWCMSDHYKTFKHQTDDYSVWTDRATPTPELDQDPRQAEDALDPDKPRGMHSY